MKYSDRKRTYKSISILNWFDISVTTSQNYAFGYFCWSGMHLNWGVKSFWNTYIQLTPCYYYARQTKNCTSIRKGLYFTTFDNTKTQKYKKGKRGKRCYLCINISIEWPYETTHLDLDKILWWILLYVKW